MGHTIGNMTVEDFARQKAEESLTSYWDGTLPVDLDVIAKALRIFKQELPLGDHNSVLSKQITRAPMITLNREQSLYSRRYYFARAIGNTIEQAFSGYDNYDLVNHPVKGFVERNAYDVLADEFALSLLMPSDEFTMSIHDELTDGQLAHLFAVPVDAVKARKLESVVPQSS